MWLLPNFVCGLCYIYIGQCWPRQPWPKPCNHSWFLPFPHSCLIHYQQMISNPSTLSPATLQVTLFLKTLQWLLEHFNLPTMQNFIFYHPFLCFLDFSHSSLLAKHNKLFLTLGFFSAIPFGLKYYSYYHSGLNSENTFSVRLSLTNNPNFACSLPLYPNTLLKFSSWNILWDILSSVFEKLVH